MKYTKSILAFLFLNLLLVFSMIFIANKTRDIEKNNNILNKQISKITEDVKINKIEFITHKNSSYLKKLYSLYFPDSKNSKLPNIVSIEQLIKKDKNIKLDFIAKQNIEIKDNNITSKISSLSFLLMI